MGAIRPGRLSGRRTGGRRLSSDGGSGMGPDPVERRHCRDHRSARSTASLERRHGPPVEGSGRRADHGPTTPTGHQPSTDHGRPGRGPAGVGSRGRPRCRPRLPAAVLGRGRESHARPARSAGSARHRRPQAGAGGAGVGGCGQRLQAREADDGTAAAGGVAGGGVPLRRVYAGRAVPGGGGLRLSGDQAGDRSGWVPRARDAAGHGQDFVRQNGLVPYGWRVLRFTWRQVVRQPHMVAAATGAALAALQAA